MGTSKKKTNNKKTSTKKMTEQVECSSGLAKTTLQGTVKGRIRQSNQKKRWEGNIREWTGLEFAKSQKAVENRE